MGVSTQEEYKRYRDNMFPVKIKKHIEWRYNGKKKHIASTIPKSELTFRRYLKHNYNITLDEYNALTTKQGGMCGICGRPPNGRRLAIDHNHQTGKTRGLLCTRCNLLLGNVNDNINTLINAIRYLKQSNGN